MSKFMMPTLETERLILRAIKTEDVQDMYEYASKQDVTAFTSFKPHETLVETRDIIDTVFLSRPDKGWPEAFALVDKSSGKMIGTCDFWPVLGDECYEMGYILNPNYWCQGIMTEAASRVLQFAFEDYGVRRMSIRHKSHNIGSKKVIEKLGFNHEGTQKSVFIANERAIDIEFYGLLKEEYDEKRIRKKI